VTGGEPPEKPSNLGCSLRGALNLILNDNLIGDLNMFITNAFSINMLSNSAQINFIKISQKTAKEFSRFASSAIGHEDTAKAVSILLEDDFQQNRISLEFKGSLLVAQYRGPRLEEGTTTLPEESKIEFWLVTIYDSAEDAIKAEEIAQRDHQEGVFWEFDPRS